MVPSNISTITFSETVKRGEHFFATAMILNDIFCRSLPSLSFNLTIIFGKSRRKSNASNVSVDNLVVKSDLIVSNNGT